MRIDAVDFFYLSMPVVTTEADGSQDADSKLEGLATDVVALPVGESGVVEIDPETGREVPLHDASPAMDGVQLPLLDGGARLFLVG